MKMISMKRTEADKRGDKMENAPMSSMAADYPYGLVIHMDKDELDKIGMKQLPGIGTEIPMEILVKVTSVRQSATENKEETSVDFQITDISIDTESEKE